MSNKTEITYEHLKLSPFGLVSIKEIEIERCINEHGILNFTGIVPEDVKDEYIFDSDFGTVVELKSDKEEDPRTIFSGILKDVGVKKVGEFYQLKGTVVTHSFLFDVEIKSRSFQNINETYYAVVNRITKETKGGDVLFTADKGATLGGFTIQYKETNWEFLKRLAAANFNEGLYPDSEQDSAKYFFGVPDIDNQKTIDEDVFTVRKDLSGYKFLSTNYIDGVMSLDFVTYEVETYLCLALGEKVKYRDISFYVKSIYCIMIEGVLRFTYKLCTKNGLKQKRFANGKLQGVSIFGHVIDVQRDKVKVHIHDIDESQDVGTAYWFPYSSMYASEDGSGFYCMPEIGDDVRIEFPSTNEKEAIAVSSVSKYDPKAKSPKDDRMGDTEVRYIRNPQGMEVTLTPSQVVINSNNAGVIVMDEAGKVSIFAQDTLTINGKNIVVNAGESIQMQASDNINIKCEKAEIKMGKDGIMEFLGNEVYTN